MKTALITGVTGQDGLYLSKLLLDKEYKVVGTTRDRNNINEQPIKYLDIQNKLIIEELNLLDKNAIVELIHKYKPDEIYNLAAQSSVAQSFKKPIETFLFNTTSVNNLLETIREFSVKIKLYQASSSEMFGRIDDLPISLESPMNPISPYGISKMASHFMVKTYRKSYNLFVTSGILFNHESFLRKDNFFIKKIIKDSILIKNKKLDRLIVGNLNVKRDFGYAPKYVEVMWKMLQLEKADDFIICSGEAVLLKDIVDYVFDKLKLDKKLIVEDKKLFRPNEIEEIYGDNSNAVKKLNWNYNFSFFNILDMLIDEEIVDYDK